MTLMMAKHKNKSTTKHNSKAGKVKLLNASSRAEVEDCQLVPNARSNLHTSHNKVKMRGLSVLSSRGRQRIGWRWRKKGMSVLSSAVKKSPHKMPVILKKDSFEGAGFGHISKQTVKSAKCMIVDLTKDSDEDSHCDLGKKLSNKVQIFEKQRSTSKPVEQKLSQRSVKAVLSDDNEMKSRTSAGSMDQPSDGFTPLSSDCIDLDDSSNESDLIAIDSASVSEEGCCAKLLPVLYSSPRDGNNEKFVCRQFDNKTVLMMKHPCEVSVKGQALIQCLQGTVTVFGYNLQPNSKEYALFCPNSSSYLTVKSVNNSSVANHSSSHIPDICKLEPEMRQLLKKYPIVVTFQPLRCSTTEFICQHDKFRNLFEELDISCVSSSSVDTVLIPDAVTAAVECWLSDLHTGLNTTLAVCGGLNTGKSTTCRYIINQTVNVFPEVAYLECDIGQTEFTAPGCVSLTVISEPLLGPPFTHHRTTVSSVFVGQTSPAGCAEFYVQCLKHVYAAYLRLPSRPPLIINTMGWLKDVGLSLLVDTLRLTRPGYVIQLYNDRLRHIRTLPMMTPDFLASADGVILDQTDDTSIDYKWLRVTSGVNARPKGSDNVYNAPGRRELSVLAYFGQLCCTSLRTVTPYRVLWTNVAIHVCHESIPKSQILYAINGNIVSLCIADPSEILDSGVDGCPKFLRRNIVCECVGFGIVRSISEVEKALYIITPVSPSVLQTVNCLQLGAVNMPSCLLTSNEPAACNAPYVDHVQKVPKVQTRRPNGRRRKEADVDDSIHSQNADSSVLDVNL